MSKTDEHQPISQTGLMTAGRTISPAIQKKLGEQLRAMYREIEVDGLPDHLLNLLEQLDEPRSGEVP
jgi:hypothetical protein